MALFDDLGADAAMVFPGVLLGTAAVHLGWYESAHSQGQASLALAQEVDDQAGVAHALLLLGRVALVREAYVEAQSLLSESVTIFQTSGKQDEMAQALAWAIVFTS